MKTIWDWFGSPAYFKWSASLTGIYLTIVVLGKTGDWMYAASIAFGFYLVWYYSKRAIEAAHNIGAKP